MALRRLQVSDFRCVQAAELQFDSRFTLISGPNAAGKTSLLEAVYLLARGRSFRTRSLETLIRSTQSQFVVFGETDWQDRRVVLGIEGSAAGMRAKLGGQRVASLAELAAVLPVQIIDPEVHRLIEEGPSRRRRFLDWGVFHVEHAFVGHWQQYQIALRQRNAALKSRQPRAVVVAWDGELLRLGELIDLARRRYVEQLGQATGVIARALLGLELTLTYRSGWPRDMTFAEALAQSWSRDVEVGATSVGPQRAELAIRLAGSAVKDRISRGQQKLLAAALLMAQVDLFPAEASARPTLLLDDPAAELDAERLLGLIRQVAQSSVQLIVTSLSADFRAFGSPGRRYAVDGGVVREI
jgi:DNA replication and repair protein RecF